MTKEQKYPKWTELRKRYQQQLDRLEAAKQKRSRENGHRPTTQQQINRLTRLAQSYYN